MKQNIIKILSELHLVMSFLKYESSEIIKCQKQKKMWQEFKKKTFSNT